MASEPKSSLRIIGKVIDLEQIDSEWEIRQVGSEFELTTTLESRYRPAIYLPVTVTTDEEGHILEYDHETYSEEGHGRPNYRGSNREEKVQVKDAIRELIADSHEPPRPEPAPPPPPPASVKPPVEIPALRDLQQIYDAMVNFNEPLAVGLISKAGQTGFAYTDVRDVLLRSIKAWESDESHFITDRFVMMRPTIAAARRVWPAPDNPLLLVSALGLVGYIYGLHGIFTFPLLDARVIRADDTDLDKAILEHKPAVIVLCPAEGYWGMRPWDLNTRIERIRQIHPTAKIVVTGEHNTPDNVSADLHADTPLGAFGVLKALLSAGLL